MLDADRPSLHFDCPRCHRRPALAVKSSDCFVVNLVINCNQVHGAEAFLFLILCHFLSPIRPGSFLEAIPVLQEGRDFFLTDKYVDFDPSEMLDRVLQSVRLI